MSAIPPPPTNRLAESSSRYLRQHANDPVAWQPYGQAAFDLADSLDRPLLLSIGYSACHWWRVMAHETFNKPEIADFLNNHFICIKVDREEHPDVDALYMEALIAQQGNGGWPITVFATATGVPIYCATYLPPFTSAHLPGLLPIAEKIIRLRDEQPETLLEASREYESALSSQHALPQTSDLELDSTLVLEQMITELWERFDPEFGGFGNQPKFPQPYVLDILWRSRRLADDPARVETMVTTTLKALANGGIHDHIDGGFFRYSTDRFWITPHFEKMLYDQAGLLSLFATVAVDTDDEDLRWVARRIFSFAVATLKLENGLYASSTDADAEGDEGGYYLLGAKELKELLADEYDTFAQFYGVSAGGNFEGRSILHRPTGASPQPNSQVSPMLPKVSSYRRDRTELGIDDKATCDGNAAWAAALLRAGRFLSDSEMLNEGLQLIERIRAMFREGDDLFHVSYQQTANIDGFASDYVNYAGGMLEAFTSTGEVRWIDEASWALKRAITLFTSANGPELAIGRRGGTLPFQSFDRYDGATPSTNSLFAWLTHRVGFITDDSELQETARQVIHAYLPLIARVPASFSILCWVHTELELGTTEVLIPGHGHQQLVDVALSNTRGDLIVVHGDATPLLTGLESGSAYLCQNRACHLPTTDPAALRSALERIE
ncbi:thioredoxin domain-containing protein [Ferrimicrobium acidiphilum]|uniref:thioredoxin domain-containing protein n=1 Tax=Ferrimicrobium acidiphilum TaxID=121039 RepID=UPI0023F14EA3|nr:thioredoxin domain-containing protein [Ferrimicrobium acidiphilum]